MVISEWVFYVLMFGRWFYFVLHVNGDGEFVALGWCELCLAMDDFWFCFGVLE